MKMYGINLYMLQHNYGMNHYSWFALKINKAYSSLLYSHSLCLRPKKGIVGTFKNNRKFCLLSKYGKSCTVYIIITKLTCL